MLCYSRIEVSKGIDVNKTSFSKECIVTIPFFLDKSFKFQRSICNGCHFALMMAMSLNNIAIFNIQGIIYHCIVIGITKSASINLFKNADLSEKSDIL